MLRTLLTVLAGLSATSAYTDEPVRISRDLKFLPNNSRVFLAENSEPRVFHSENRHYLRVTLMAGKLHNEVTEHELLSLLNVGIPTDFRKVEIDNDPEIGHLMPFKIEEADELIINATLDGKVLTKENENLDHNSQSPSVEATQEKREVSLSIRYRKGVAYIMFKELWNLDGEAWELKSCKLKGSISL